MATKRKVTAVRCPNPQCNSKDIKSLHSGYVKHRNAGEPACPASIEGHRKYTNEQRKTQR